MRKRSFITVLVIVPVIGVFASITQALDISKVQCAPMTGSAVEITRVSMPLPFTKNEGQWAPGILFRTNADGATVWFTTTGVYYQITRRIQRTDSVGIVSGRANPLHLPGHEFERDSVETLLIKATFVDANLNPEVVAEGMLEYKCNYFLGNDPAKWRTDVPNYSAVTLRGIYPGIDVKYSGDGNGGALYEFRAAPGADLSQVKVAYEGAETALNSEGKLIVSTAWGDMMEAIAVPAGSASAATPLVNRALDNSATAGISAFNRSVAQSAVVALSYSAYLGGGSVDLGYAIAVDAGGNAFVTGSTVSSDFPTLNPYQTAQGFSDVFVTKLGSSGNTLIYSTYIGGGSDDAGFGVAVDAGGSAFVAGTTASSDFPTLNPYQADQGDRDVFVTKLGSFGNALIYSTYIGGGSSDGGNGIAIDGGGNAYVRGGTFSSDFPTLNPFQTYQGGSDIIVTKLGSSGNSLIYSTYIGGGSNEFVYGLAVDGGGNAYVTGTTISFDYPTQNSYQTAQGGWDVFVTKLGSFGNALIYSTYFGGGSNDFAYGVAVDFNGNAFVAGQTYSSNLPTQNPYQTDQGGADVFVTKFGSSGNALIYSTYLGGGSDDGGNSIAVDFNGNAFVTGYTVSSDFPTLNPYQTDQGSEDVFVTKFGSSGNALIYSTYLGGGLGDFGSNIAIDGGGNAFVTGYTESSDFPTLNPYQTDQGLEDAFVTKLSEPPCCVLGGDTDNGGDVNIGDALAIIDYIFGGPQPDPPCLPEADADRSGDVNIGDVLLIIDYIFGGPLPDPGCGP